MKVEAAQLRTGKRPARQPQLLPEYQERNGETVSLSTNILWFLYVQKDTSMIRLTIWGVECTWPPSNQHLSRGIKYMETRQPNTATSLAWHTQTAIMDKHSSPREQNDR